MINITVLNYLRAKLQEKYPNKSESDYNVVLAGLVQFFQMVKESENNEVPMYSESVDYTWHQFILNTREYHNFCQEYFGKFLHHIPSNQVSKDWRGDFNLRKFFISSSIEFGYNPFDTDKGVIEIFRADEVMNIPFFIDGKMLSNMVISDKNNISKKKTWWFGKAKYSEYDAFLAGVGWSDYVESISKKFVARNKVAQKEPIVNTQNVTSPYTPFDEGQQTQNLDLNILLSTLIEKKTSAAPVEIAPVRVDAQKTESSVSSPAHKHTSHTSGHTASHSSTYSSYSCGSSGHSSHSHSCASHSHSCSSSSCGGGF